MNKGRSASLHSMRGFRKKSQNTEEPSLPPFFLCDAFFCLYLIDAVNNQQESRERERERGRHSKGPWLRFKPGPAALNHTAYGCLFTEVNQRPIPKFNFTETCPCLGEYNRIKQNRHLIIKNLQQLLDIRMRFWCIHWPFTPSRSQTGLGCSESPTLLSSSHSINNCDRGHNWRDYMQAKLQALNASVSGSSIRSGSISSV